ncbi:hypothetical protein [Aquimarina brevivitae]|uniref:DUF4421 domain-containing protein n=1 Tax=Aquimarina brevivitae TaxID=323412 RepID=A0A4Q7PIY4_9FLAO|nr:hypothetical protein [Aquimarina brevivitae]RZT00228.1 hypothetical protein EV197_1464 [Aquimarina brevivitae]
MKATKNILLFFLVHSFFAVYGQSTDLARLEYTNIPLQGSDNQFSRFRISGNIPFKLNDKGSYLVIETQYRYHSLQVKDPVPFIDPQGLDALQTYGLALGYTFKINQNWRFGAKFGTRMSSNFEASGIEADDFRYTGSFYFIRTSDKSLLPLKSRLIVGVQYSNPASIRFPLPILNYYRRFKPRWSFALGTPKSNIKYFFNEKNTLQLFVSLDQFYANLQNDRIITQNGLTQIAENISLITVVNALGYEHYFTEHLLYYAYAGYTLLNEIRLRDKDQEDVYILNDQNTFYFRSGIKIKI